MAVMARKVTNDYKTRKERKGKCKKTQKEERESGERERKEVGVCDTSTNRFTARVKTMIECTLNPVLKPNIYHQSKITTALRNTFRVYRAKTENFNNID